MLLLMWLAAGFSVGGGELGFGQNCDAVTICPETSRDGVMIPSVSLEPSFILRTARRRTFY
jgi:hypothetical protein